ncbi:hypothetical protein AB6A40_001138 [Gnathostoma spinigerum]|uniref:Integrin beta subunit VWA domain-containing protein n=1 Tax=Gnathostoma spinigerum TaxID=75299 RepID=A0ABD6E3H3_9BILA
MLRWFLAFGAIFSVLSVDVQELCRSEAAEKSCSACLKQHPSCSWCMDPHMTSSFRCDSRTELEGKCGANFIFSPKGEVQLAPQYNLPLGSKQSDGSTVIQIDPQRVEVKIRPGEIVEVPYKYMHRNDQATSDFVLQTSEFRSLGVGLEFFIICQGHRQQGRQCPQVKPGQVVEFFIKVSLNECRARDGMAISVGSYGYNSVSGLYITPICDCDCDKPQMKQQNSPLCHGKGSLSCGHCECTKGFGGAHCECDLQRYGVRTDDELNNRCRKTPDDAICSGNGVCRCGQCQCTNPSITGQFCECSRLSCPKVDGRFCAGQGECVCGKCRCQPGFSGDDCGCSMDTAPCQENKKICNDHGSCVCGKCVCNNGYTGRTCGESPYVTVESKEDDIIEEKHKESAEGDGEMKDEGGPHGTQDHMSTEHHDDHKNDDHSDDHVGDHIGDHIDDHGDDRQSSVEDKGQFGAGEELPPAEDVADNGEKEMSDVGDSGGNEPAAEERSDSMSTSTTLLLTVSSFILSFTVIHQF